MTGLTGRKRKEAVKALDDVIYGLNDLKDFCRSNIIEPQNIENVLANVRRVSRALKTSGSGKFS